MADERIDSYVSPRGQAELDKATQTLQDMVNLITSINKQRISFSADVSGAGNMKQLVDGVEKLIQSKGRLANASKLLTEAQAAEKVATQEYNRQQLELAKAVNTTAQARKSASEQNKKLAQEERELNRLIAEEERQNAKIKADAARIAAKEKADADRAYVAMWKQQLKEQETAARNTAREIAAQQKIVAREREVADRAEQQAMQKAAAEAEKARSAYYVLNKEYEKSSRLTRDLAAAHGVEDAAVKKSAADTAVLANKLKEIDALVGVHRRNVGNYSSAWNGLGNAFNQLARETPNFFINFNTGIAAVSNNLPILFDEIARVRTENAALIAQGKPTVSVFKQIAGAIFSWQTLLVVGVSVLTAYGKELGNFFKGATKATLEAEKAQKKYSKTLNDAEEQERSDAQQKIARLTLLITLANNDAQSTRTRTRAVKELQETYPATFGALTKQTILEGKLGDAVRLTTQALLDRAATEAAEKKFAAASESVYDLQLALRTAQKELDKLEPQGRPLSAMQPLQGRDKEETGLNQFINQARISELKKNISDINKLLEEARENQTQFLRDVQSNALKAGDVLFGKDPKTSKGRGPQDLTNERLRAEQNYTKALYDELRIQAEIRAEEQKLIADNEENSLEQRLAAYNEYARQKQIAIDYELEGEFFATQQALDKITEIEKKEADKRTNEEKTLLLQKQVLLQRQTNLFSKHQLEQTKIQNDNLAAQKEAAEKYGQDQVDAVIAGFAHIEAAERVLYNEQLARINQQYADRLLTEREYQQARSRLDKQYGQAVIIQEIQHLQEYVKILADAGVNVDVLTAKIAELEAKLKGGSEPRQERGQGNKGALADSLGITKEQFDDYMRDIQEIMGLISNLGQSVNDIFKAASDARIEQYQKEIDLIDQRKEADLAAIELSALTEEQRIQKRAELEAVAAAKQAQVEERIRQEKRKQAAADKALNIMNIIGQTALAIIHQYTSGDPYTATIRAALAGAAGAAQLVAAAAAPLPQYAKGGKNLPAGWAITGEEGPELKIDSTGASLTQGRATLDYLKSNTTIIPAKETFRIMQMLGMGSMPVSRDNMAKEILVGFERHTNKVVKAIQSKNLSVTNNISNSDLVYQLRNARRK